MLLKPIYSCIIFYSSGKGDRNDDDVFGKKSHRDRKRGESVSDVPNQPKTNPRSRNASTSDTAMLLKESSKQLSAIERLEKGLSRQSSKKGGASRSRLSSSNEEPTPDMFESKVDEAKKVVVLSTRRQHRIETTNNVKAKQAEKAEILALKEKAEKANKTEGIDR